jgi:hypothetical protein
MPPGLVQGERRLLDANVRRSFPSRAAETSKNGAITTHKAVASPVPSCCARCSFCRFKTEDPSILVTAAMTRINVNTSATPVTMSGRLKYRMSES